MLLIINSIFLGPDAHPMKGSISLSPKQMEEENLFEEDIFIATSSPTDV